MTRLSPYIYAWGRWGEEFEVRTLRDVERVHPRLGAVTLAFLTSDRYEEVREWAQECVACDIDVTLSMGGALGEFPSADKSTPAQARDVVALLREMGISSVDLDVEGTALENEAKRARWVQFAVALAQEYFEQMGTPLRMTLTLPVEFTGGFGATARSLIASMKAAAVPITCYNCMVMCFNTKLRGQKWGAKCCEVMDHAFDFLRTVYPSSSSECVWGMLGVCPMIGQNDDKTTLVTLEDWDIILNYAKTHALGLVTFWALNRDQRKPRLKRGTCYAYSLAQERHHAYAEAMIKKFQ